MYLDKIPCQPRFFFSNFRCWSRQKLNISILHHFAFVNMYRYQNYYMKTNKGQRVLEQYNLNVIVIKKKNVLFDIQSLNYSKFIGTYQRKKLMHFNNIIFLCQCRLWQRIP